MKGRQELIYTPNIASGLKLIHSTVYGVYTFKAEFLHKSFNFPHYIS